MSNRNGLSGRRFRKGGGAVPAALVLLLAAASLAGLSPVLTAYADFDLAHWRYFKQVIIPPGVAAGDLIELALDREVFQESAVGQSDLRLIGGGQEVAYQLVVAEGRQERRSVPVKLRDLGYVPGEHASFVADLGGGGSLHNEVEVFTKGKNFRRSVVVEASRDAETWAVLEEGSEIYDFTVEEQGFNARNTRVSYPESAARYLRVRVLNGGAGPLEIDGASVALAEDFPAVETPYSPKIVSSGEDAETGASFWIVDLGSRGIPTRRLSFRTSESNFHRSATVAGINDREDRDREDWQLLGSSVIYSYDTAKFTGSLLSMGFPESRHRYYRFTIQNLDDPPLPAEGITLHGLERKLIFRSQPGVEFALYYGNPEARRPSYDLERILPYLRTGDKTGGLHAAALGAQQANTSFTGFDVPLTERFPWLAPVGVIVAALAVAALLFGVFRQARKVLPPPDASPGG